MSHCVTLFRVNRKLRVLTLFRAYSGLFTLTHAHSRSFTLVQTQPRSLTLIHARSNLFTLIHTYSYSFTLIHAYSRNLVASRTEQRLPLQAAQVWGDVDHVHGLCSFHCIEPGEACAHFIA